MVHITGSLWHFDFRFAVWVDRHENDPGADIPGSGLTEDSLHIGTQTYLSDDSIAGPVPEQRATLDESEEVLHLTELVFGSMWETDPAQFPTEGLDPCPRGIQFNKEWDTTGGEEPGSFGRVEAEEFGCHFGKPHEDDAVVSEGGTPEAGIFGFGEMEIDSPVVEGSHPTSGSGRMTPSDEGLKRTCSAQSSIETPFMRN